MFSPFQIGVASRLVNSALPKKNTAPQGRRGDCGYVITAVTHCPGEISCSGHGVCSGSPTYRCDCSDGWQGADCSLKTCPSGKSWFMRPTDENVAHLTLTECSDMGTCDRVSGECACMGGFEGAACDRMSCPGTAATGAPCNGHGQCVTMAMLAEATDENGVATDYTYGGTPNNPLTWDHDMVQVGTARWCTSKPKSSSRGKRWHASCVWRSSTR